MLRALFTSKAFAVSGSLLVLATTSVASAQAGAKVDAKVDVKASGGASAKAPAPGKKASGGTPAQRKAAREAYDAGTIAFEKGDYALALENYSKANSIIASPAAMYWIARSLDSLERKPEAIQAYEDVLAHPDASTLSADKTETARSRLAALKAEQAVPASNVAAAPAEPPPAEAAPPPPPQPAEPSPAEAAPPPPPPADWTVTPDMIERERKKPKMWFEVGLFTGPLFILSSHNLQEMQYEHRDYDIPSWLVGVRGAFFPIQFVGVEVEYAHGWGSVDTEGRLAGLGPGSDTTNIDTVRGHVVGQLPVGKRFFPFATLGAGWLHAMSDNLGNDGDFILTGGIGAKIRANKQLMPRLDLRLDMTQKEGGTFWDGVTVHPEILVGLSVVLGD